MNKIRFQSFKGPEIGKYIDHLADLRIGVFREYPYLYDGDAGYERKYLQRYLNCDHCLIILAFDDRSAIPIGASTAIPLVNEIENTKQPFLDQGLKLDSFCYFGESVVNPHYRGQGIGRRFFEMREAHAMALNLSHACFCAVVRPDNHPSKPAQYYSNEAFWERLGYRKQANLETDYSWKEIGGEEEESHSMQFWTKSLTH